MARRDDLQVFAVHPDGRDYRFCGHAPRNRPDVAREVAERYGVGASTPELSNSPPISYLHCECWVVRVESLRA